MHCITAFLGLIPQQGSLQISQFLHRTQSTNLSSLANQLSVNPEHLKLSLQSLELLAVASPHAVLDL